MSVVKNEAEFGKGGKKGKGGALLLRVVEYFELSNQPGTKAIWQANEEHY